MQQLAIYTWPEVTITNVSTETPYPFQHDMQAVYTMADTNENHVATWPTQSPGTIFKLDQIDNNTGCSGATKHADKPGLLVYTNRLLACGEVKATEPALLPMEACGHHNRAEIPPPCRPAQTNM